MTGGSVSVDSVNYISLLHIGITPGVELGADAAKALGLGDKLQQALKSSPKPVKSAGANAVGKCIPEQEKLSGPQLIACEIALLHVSASWSFDWPHPLEMVSPTILGEPIALSPSGQSQPVTACPASGPGIQPSLPAVPAAAAIPSSVALPVGARVYGTAAPFSPSVLSSTPTPSFVFTLGPTDFICAATAYQDGGFSVFLTAPGTSQPSVNYAFAYGGVANNIYLACPYIPAVPTAGFGGPCDHPTADLITQVPTGGS